MKNFVTLLIVMTSYLTYAQIEISSVVEDEFHVCEENSQTTFTINNNGDNPATGITFQVKLPKGVKYLSNQVNSGLGIALTSNTGDSIINFSANDLPVGDSIDLVISYNANMESIDGIDAGLVFRNRLEFNSSYGTENHTSRSFNVLYPSLNITNVSPTAVTIISGTSTQRAITVVNAGYGKISSFVLTDVLNDSDLSLDAVDVGSLSGSDITIGATELQAIGNGDAYFDLGETIVITETLSGISCSDKTVTSTINVTWGCDGATRTTSNSYANITIDFQSPNLTLQTTDEESTCYEDLSEHTVTVTNSGNGIATNIVLDIYKSSGGSLDDDIISKIILGSVQYQINGGGYTSASSIMTHTTGQDAGVYSCLGANPVNSISLSLPNIAPGDNIDVKWDMSSCCIDVCLNESITGWRTEVSYSDICSITSYDKNKVGQSTTSHVMSLFTETPADIYDQIAQDFHFIVSSFENNLPMAVDGRYKLLFTLDNDLSFNSVNFNSNGISWTALSVTQPTSNTVEAVFELPEPFVVAKSEIVLSVSGNCGSAGWKTVGLNIFAQPDPSCPTCEVPLVCDEEVTTYLHCPLTNCEGMSAVDFTAQRISFGSPDNDLNGLADGSGSLDFSKIKLNRCMVGDTMEAKMIGVFNATNSYDYLYLETTNDYGSVLDVAEMEVFINDASASTSHTVSLNTFSNQINSNAQTFSFDLSSSTLAALDPALSGFSYDDGDSVVVSIKYKVVSSVTGDIQESTFTNDFYASQVANPTSGQKASCGFRSDRITLIGYSFKNDVPNNTTVNNCNKQITQNFGMSIGDAPSNYAGGNLFPYEYRHWGVLSQVHVVIPQNYQWLDVALQSKRTKNTNSVATQNISIVPDYVSSTGDTLIFNIQQYFDNATLNKSDDGFEGKISVRLAPTCDVPENTWQDVDWTLQYQKSAAIDGLNSGDVLPSGSDRVRYRRADIQLSSDNPWQDVNQRNVVWDYKITNNSSNGSDNNWIHLVSPPNITIDSIVNDQTGVALTLQNDIYLVGTIGGGSTANLSIYGSISNCDQVLISTYAGYECSGYPTDFASFECPYNFMPIYVEPKPAAFQTRLETNTVAGSCSNEVELIVEIASVKIAHVYDMDIKMNVADSSKIKIKSSTSEFLYNLSSSYQLVSDPNYNAGEYTFNINDLESTFAADGLPGVFDLNNNRYRLKTTLVLGENFENGDHINLQINGETPCAIALPTTNLAYDPSVKFSKNTTANLHNDIINSWSASWGDYDNDGFDDLFVPGKGTNEGNHLYHNNQDGTFTSVSMPPLTSAQGASVSGSWGDYDNDGDLDIFVCNNENGTNKLYENNGGSFTDVTPIVLLSEGLYSHSSAWADYNKDGYLDLVVSDFHPTHFNRLFIGQGNGNFILAENSQVSLASKSSVGVAWGDYDNDGDLDLFIANTNDEFNDLYENVNGELILTQNNPIVADSAHSVGGTWGDYDNDGDLDLYVTNSKNTEANFFYENNGDATFTKITNKIITQDLTNAHGATWIDFDNDGDLDLTVANDQYGNNLFYNNNGDQTFTKMTNAITQEDNQSYGLAWADYDNDGDYDLYVANQNNTKNEFYANEKGACTNYISVKLEGCHSNRNGIGATIRVKANMKGVDKWQTKHVSTQTSGMAGQNSMSLLFGLDDATTVDSLIVLWPSGIVTELSTLSPNQLLTINEECGSKVCGLFFNDVNGNGIQESGEAPIPNQPVTITPGGYQAYSNHLGQFQLFLPDGNYDLSWGGHSNWNQTLPASSGTYSLVIDKNTNTTYCGNDFGLTSDCPNPDLSVDLGTSAFRRGLPNQLDVLISNESGNNTTESFDVTLTVSDFIYILDTDWAEEVGDQGEKVYRKSFTGLDALQDTLLSLTDSVGLESNIDEVAIINAKVIYNGTECTLDNNEKEFRDFVVGSLDPNDKLVMVINNPEAEYANEGDRIYYKIRFQNIGNYAARIVLIEDQLSEKLDWSTFQLMSSSHEFNFSMVEGKLRWYNPMIELPDSTSDLEGSQGYVSFSIEPIKGLSKMTRIDNEASIRFDYNEPIITNVASIYANGLDTERDRYLHVRPNPATDLVEIIPMINNLPVTDVASVSFCDLHGKPVRVMHEMNDYTIKADISDLLKGAYLVEVRLSDGTMIRAKFIKM